MDYSVTFTRHFARLVWLLMHEPTNIDEQKTSLRALVTVAREGAIALATNGIELMANGTPLPPALAGVSDVVARMEAHGLRAIDVDREPAASDLLGAARALVAEAGGATHPAPTARVRFVVRPRTPGSAVAVPRTTPSAGVAKLPDIDVGEMPDDPRAARRERATPARSLEEIAASRPDAGRGGGGMFDQFAVARP